MWSPELLRELAAHAILFAAGWWLVVGLRWGPVGPTVGGILAVTGFVQLIVDGIRLIHRRLGWDMPAPFRRPLAASSIADFWGRRWNRTVSSWLRRHVAGPLARRYGPLAGSMGAFTVSAGLHASMILPALGVEAAASMAAFFWLQVPLLWFERKFLRRSSPWRRAWAVVSLVAVSPLFTIPFRKVLFGTG
jgi:hypothetical protein